MIRRVSWYPGGVDMMECGDGMVNALQLYMCGTSSSLWGVGERERV